MLVLAGTPQSRRRKIPAPAQVEVGERLAKEGEVIEAIAGIANQDFLRLSGFPPDPT